jgi:TRAP transporter TAXI family solute receptor
MLGLRLRLDPTYLRRANACGGNVNSDKSQMEGQANDGGPRNPREDERMRLRTLLALGAAAAIGAATAHAQSKQLEIATGGTGGVYYPLGGGFGNILGKELPGVTATARVTGGSVANLQLIGSGKADLCFTQVDAAWDAIHGTGKFASGKLPITALAVMYANYMHVVTVEGTGINKVEDMKGRRVSTGSPGSATEVFAIRVLEAAGLDHEKDIRKERLGVAESVNAIKDKKIDAFFFVVGLPTSSITDLANTPNTKIKIIDHVQYLDKMKAKYGNIYAAGTMPKTTYAGMDKDSEGITVWNIMAVNAKTDDKLAYDLTRIMLTKQKDLALVHKEALNIKREWQTSSRAGIPWHPGALKFFKEQGIKVE